MCQLCTLNIAQIVGSDMLCGSGNTFFDYATMEEMKMMKMTKDRICAWYWIGGVCRDDDDTLEASTARLESEFNNNATTIQYLIDRLQYLNYTVDCYKYAL